METCVRGFSYMPESKLGVNLQYIEDGELQRAWKVSRRQRLKEQEQRIWEEFVKEQDIVHKAYKEDPYQFLHELPENCLKELLEAELSKMKKEPEEDIVLGPPSQGEGDQPSEKQVLHTVTFAEDDEPDISMFHIFDDDNDLNQSGEGEAEDEPCESPSTVRERGSYEAVTRNDPQDGQPPAAAKCTETVSSVIESSIYCARVRDLRLTLGREMRAVNASLGVLDVVSAERAELARRCRRAAEFCARFNRVYMYQLQRQAHNLKRQLSQTLPAAQHTQFQSYMLRVVSLHQNMLQALQVIHKSIPATSLVRGCGRALRGLLAFVRDTSALCRGLPAPRDLAAARALYDDELLVACEELDAAVQQYCARVAAHVDEDAPDAQTVSSSTRSKKSRKDLTYSKAGTKNGTKTGSFKDTEARLSMYSLDTSRGRASSGTSKGRAPPPARRAAPAAGPDQPRRSTVRRPLMRAPASSAPRARAQRRDGDVTTLVEAVDACESSHAASQPASPRSARAPRTPRRAPAPRAADTDLRSARGSHQTSPHKRLTNPKVKSRQCSPMVAVKPTTTTEAPTTTTGKNPISPVTKIQCAKKQPREHDPETPERNSPKSDRTEKNTDRSRSEFREDKFSCNARGIFKNKDSARKCSKNNTQMDKIAVDDLTLDLENFNDVDSCSDVKSASVVKVDDFIDEEKGNKREFCGVKELTDNDDDYSRSYAREVDVQRTERGRHVSKGSMSPARCDVTRLLRQLCSGDPAGFNPMTEKVTGAKNAQLLCVRGSSLPRQPSTPQLLRILEETIQKQSPEQSQAKKTQKVWVRNPEHYRLSFNLPEAVTNRLFQYRTRFVQHMLTSPLYANGAVGKPWEMIGSVSDKIIDDVLTGIAKEMEVNHVLRELYKCETN